MFTAGRILHKANLRNMNSLSGGHRHQKHSSSRSCNSSFYNDSCNSSFSPNHQTIQRECSFIEINDKLETNHRLSSSNFQIAQNKRLEQERIRVQKKTTRILASRLSRFYVPFIWQALLACFVGMAIITLGVCLCILGYEADREIGNSSKEKNFLSMRADDVLKNKIDHQFLKNSNLEVGAGKNNSNHKKNIFLLDSYKSNNTGHLEAVRYLIYVGPIIMSFGSFAIVFACVIVCETRDRVLDLLEKRTKQLENMIVKDLKEKIMDVGNESSSYENKHERHKGFTSGENKNGNIFGVGKNIKTEFHEIEQVNDEIVENNAYENHLIKEVELKEKNNGMHTSGLQNSQGSSMCLEENCATKNSGSNFFYKKKHKLVFKADCDTSPSHLESPFKPSIPLCKSFFEKSLTKKIDILENSFDKNDLECQDSSGVALGQDEPSGLQIDTPTKASSYHQSLLNKDFLEKAQKERRSSFQVLYKGKIDVLTNSLIKNQLKKALKAKKKSMEKKAES